MRGIVIIILLVLIPLVLAIPQSHLLEETMYSADLYGGFPFSGDINSSQNSVGFFSIMDYYPTQGNPVISPAPAQPLDDLSCLVQDYSDIETSQPISNYTKWYISGTFIVSSQNLSSSYTNNGDKVICSKIVFDGTTNSTEKNSSQLTIGDSTPPTIHRLYVSSTSVYTTETIVFYSNVTDAGSNIETDSCIYGLYQSNLITPRFNITSNTKSGDIVSRSLSELTAGTLEWQEVWCSDSSSNVRHNSSVGITITITVQSDTSGGGGGSNILPECEFDTDCSFLGLNYFCINNRCFKLEREDIAYANLLNRGLPEDIIQQLISYGQGVCNWDGVCELSEGEHKGNCGTQKKTINGKNVIIEGDCTGLEIPLPRGFLFGVFILSLVLISILYLSRIRRSKKWVFWKR